MKYRKHGPCVIAEITYDDYCMPTAETVMSLMKAGRIRNNMMRNVKVANYYEPEEEMKFLLWYLNMEHCRSLKNTV